MQYHYKQTVKENNKNTKHSSYGRQKEQAVVTSHTVVSSSDILVIKIILVLVLVSFQSNHFYFI